MLNRLLYWLTDRRPSKVIIVAGEPYLERTFIACIFGYEICIHRFLSADGDRHLHDHPWTKGFSIVLSGSYDELRTIAKNRQLPTDLAVRVTRKPGAFVDLGEKVAHQIIAVQPHTWTLMVHGQRTREWGFYEAIINYGSVISDVGSASIDNAIWHPAEDQSNPTWWKSETITTRRERRRARRIVIALEANHHA